MLLTKCEGLRYPIHFLKSKDRVIRNNSLEYRTKQATLFAWRNDHNNYKAKIYLKGIFRTHVVTQFIVKV